MESYSRWEQSRINTNGLLYLASHVRGMLKVPVGKSSMWVTSMGSVLLGVPEHALDAKDQWNHEKASHLCELMAQSEILKRLGNGSLAKRSEQRLAALHLLDDTPKPPPITPEVFDMPVNGKGFLNIPPHIERQIGITHEAIMEGTLCTDDTGDLCIMVKLKRAGRPMKVSPEERERLRLAAFAERERIKTEEMTKRRVMREQRDAALREEKRAREANRLAGIVQRRAEREADNALPEAVVEFEREQERLRRTPFIPPPLVLHTDAFVPVEDPRLVPPSPSQDT